MSGQYLLSSFMVDEPTGLISNFNGNYSITPLNGIYKPPAGHTAIIKSMTIVVEDVGGFDAGFYGNGITLANGISFKVLNDQGVINNLTNGSAVKTSGDYARYAEDLQYLSFGTGSNFLRVHHNFSETGIPIILYGDESVNERFQVTFNDDFTGLVSHTIYLSGAIIHNDIDDRQEFFHRFGSWI